jgi:hypothetical protein
MKLHSAFYSKQKEQKKKENYNKNKNYYYSGRGKKYPKHVLLYFY